MGVLIYIGKNIDKEKCYVELKENEVNYIIFFWVKWQWEDYSYESYS